MYASRGSTVADQALYTTSTLALRPDDGSLQWYYQHVPGETLDLDESYERVLVDAGGRKAGLHHRQSRHPLEARPHDRRIFRFEGNGLPERVQPD